MLSNLLKYCFYPASQAPKRIFRRANPCVFCLCVPSLVLVFGLYASNASFPFFHSSCIADKHARVGNLRQSTQLTFIYFLFHCLAALVKGSPFNETSTWTCVVVCTYVQPAARMREARVLCGRPFLEGVEGGTPDAGGFGPCDVDLRECLVPVLGSATTCSGARTRRVLLGAGRTLRGFRAARLLLAGRTRTPSTKALQAPQPGAFERFFFSVFDSFPQWAPN